VSTTAAAPLAAPGRWPRLGLAWLVWRQHRAAAAAVLAVFGAAAALLLASGLPIHAAYRDLGLGACAPASGSGSGSGQCGELLQAFDDRYFGWGLYLPRLLMFLPALVGAFVGGPLVAREFESGTVRFVWSQGRGRMRWLAATLGSMLALTTVAALALSLLSGWWFGPFERSLGRLGSAGFELGPVFAARTLFGVALGALAGAVLRRTVPAMAVTLVGWFAVVLPAALLWRPHYQAQLVAPTNGPVMDNDWTIRSWWLDRAGHQVSEPALLRVLRQVAAQGASPQAWLRQHGYTQWQAYQPDSRYWRFEAIETGMLCALAVALLAVTGWLVRRAG
jgi:hypothetical protein